MDPRIKKAVEIFEKKFPEMKYWYVPYISEINGNDVDIFTEDGLYCVVNVRSGKVKNI